MTHGRNPQAAPLTISTDQSDPRSPVIAVAGELTFTTAGPLRTAVDRALDGRPEVLVLDFTGLVFIDSTGLSVIVHAWREGQPAGTLIRLRGTPRFLTTILDMTGVSGLLARPSPARPGVAAPQRPTGSA
ncbi:STAS domain-containing protein [Micromonospora sp. WMMD987]|uniref:STAS domain-containing protein n=1 Tax=Micromonospora TaxID=1873 RepID=UPI00249CE728|nr:STAS domain-containing protein [Micromonospora sp. WMMD987]WFE93314.1 STAS domain-containing protein [Micromonospora sp. WMMD987]